MRTTSFQSAPRVRARPSPRGQQYLALLNARREMNAAQNLGIRNPKVRALTATALERLDDVIGRLEGRATANPDTAKRLLQLDLDVVRLRRPSVH